MNPAAPALHLVRHGQSTWNLIGLVQGQTAHPELTELGRDQAVRAATRLADLPIVRLLTSDLVRAAQTAEIIGAAIGVRPQATALLREQDVGDLEGRPSDDAALAWEAAAQALDVYGDPIGAVDVRPGGGESLRDVLARVTALLASPWITEAAGDVVLVSHGDTIRVMLAHLLGDEFEDLDWRRVDNGEVHSVHRTDDGAVRYVVRSGALVPGPQG
ncbi:probable phosphoglycerate mutase [Nakamurella panacisegetis]|uniref:Probable phosphoglycerate mutase n=1 Tax=Nakamurella panacisegetis TaxID=1090615 RepID=A0A1H0HZ44_9ACTN|nr:histidine phosphatase family protein [Nakamurella panacisegetis]SDO24419.1 probable phosphoglycerate mutase [Nakamurella panacisegetis]